MAKDWNGNGNSIFKTLGASNHTEKERETDDFYATDPVAIDLLCDYPHIHMPNGVWEPSCGSGCLSERLRQRGHDVVSTTRRPSPPASWNSSNEHESHKSNECLKAIWQ